MLAITLRTRLPFLPRKETPHSIGLLKRMWTRPRVEPEVHDAGGNQAWFHVPSLRPVGQSDRAQRIDASRACQRDALSAPEAADSQRPRRGHGLGCRGCVEASGSNPGMQGPSWSIRAGYPSALCETSL